MMDDSGLLERYRQRDEEAIVQTEALYGKRLLRLAMQILHSEEAAEEAVNDTYYKLWEAIPPADPQSLGAYAMQVCRRTAFSMCDRDHAAKRSAQLVTLSEEMAQCLPDHTAQAAFTDTEMQEILNAFLRSLSANRRRIFVRRYFYADSVKEIATRYRVGESYVKTSLHRARNKLRDILAKEGITV